MYDLLQNPILPVASEKLPQASLDLGEAGKSSRDRHPACAACDVSFNPRQRDLIVTGDSHGQVLVWQLSWRLANKKAGEEAMLERLFKGSAGEVRKL